MPGSRSNAPTAQASGQSKALDGKRYKVIIIGRIYRPCFLVYNGYVKRNPHLLLPAVLSAGSFLCLLALVLLSNPVENISYAIFFFAALFISLLSLGHYWV